MAAFRLFRGCATLGLGGEFDNLIGKIRYQKLTVCVHPKWTFTNQCPISAQQALLSYATPILINVANNILFCSVNYAGYREHSSGVATL